MKTLRVAKCAECVQEHKINTETVHIAAVIGIISKCEIKKIVL
jgi:hypothetical protein